MPFYIRAGKSMPTSVTEVYVELRRPPAAVEFGQRGVILPNAFRFRLSPNVAISLAANVKAPGEDIRGEQVELAFAELPDDGLAPYERLLGDALGGDGTLFAREDNVEAAWALFADVLDDATPAYSYAAGSWGPAEADMLLAAGHSWQNPGTTGE